MSDKVEKRKEKDEKPRKLFSFKALIYDDGNMCGMGYEHRNIGRMKNQKIGFPGKEEFIAEIRSQLPSALPLVEDVINAVYNDNGVTDTLETEKIGQASFDIYADGAVITDFAEIIKGARGAPKAWRKTPRDFVNDLSYRAGSLGEVFKPLLTAGSSSGEIVIEASKE